jgi:hypothetical protein
MVFLEWLYTRVNFKVLRNMDEHLKTVKVTRKKKLKKEIYSYETYNNMA